MKRRTLLVAGAVLPLVAVAADASTTTHDHTHFSIDLPQGYIGPSEHVAGASVSHGFRKPYPGTALNSVILVTVQEMGPSFARRVPTERARLTRETLDPIVAGLEGNRVGFHRSEPANVAIAGYAGLKIAWIGVAQGIAFDGVVYCVLAGSRAIAIQIQDPIGRDKARLAEAMRAVERMRIRK
ncbi:MAG: hypothetical protein ACREUX_18190 [Burkholderiales bacterium]